MEDLKERVVRVLAHGATPIDEICGWVEADKDAVFSVLSDLIDNDVAKSAGAAGYALTESGREDLLNKAMNRPAPERPKPKAEPMDDAEKLLLAKLLSIYQSRGWAGRASLAGELGVNAWKIRELQRELVKRRHIRMGKDGRYCLVKKRQPTGFTGRSDANQGM